MSCSQGKGRGNLLSWGQQNPVPILHKTTERKCLVRNEDVVNVFHNADSTVN